ncbi:MAG: class I SAM-dependent methyltransferase [Dongiaceae bacterium]
MGLLRRLRSNGRFVSGRLKRSVRLISRRVTESTLSPDYYQRLHEENQSYQQNNWLVPETEAVLACRPRTVVEIGCGNGRFLREIASCVEHVIGLDWAVSPIADTLPENVSLVQADVAKDAIPAADLVCSADVLEHFHPKDIKAVLAKLHAAAPFNFHVIACYDDGRGHLTIQSPERWLAAFKALAPTYRLIKTSSRSKDRVVCVIANY